jgi:nitric oxide reductase activation protein
MQKYINSGISMGIKIGKRLQFRNEVNIDKFSRRETGRIDKRLLHELGCESENVFYTIATSKYKKMNFHISVDASSSMRGNKWFRTMRLCTAIAKAASMLDNIRVTISFRTTMEKLPYVVIGYDSAVDKFVKIHNLFALLSPDGLTPEGLSFEAIMRTLPKNETNTENYFINISDGEPCYNYNGDGTDYMINYSGEAAARHTRKQVKKIREMGYGVLSYFIAENNSMSDKLNQLFKIMYADDAYFINVDNINQIVKTLNQKLMESVDL